MDSELLNKFSFKDFSKRKGVYLISCNNHKYIGSTCNLYVRLRSHYNALKKKTHYNSFLQNVCNKYGIDQFRCQILEICENYIEKEEFYITTMNPDINVERHPESKTKSQSTKDKLSIALKGKYPGAKNPSAIKVYQYSYMGEYMQEFGCAVDAGKAIGVSNTLISSCVNGWVKSAGGYLWSKNKSNLIAPGSKRTKGSQKHMNLTIREITTGDTVIWNKGVTELAKMMRVKRSKVYDAIRNKSDCGLFRIEENHF